jgi:hypothetical protein
LYLYVDCNVENGKLKLKWAKTKTIQINLNKTSMAKDMGPFRDSQAPFVALWAPNRCTY